MELIFSNQFASRVKAGKKRQTVRRWQLVEAGDDIYLIDEEGNPLKKTTVAMVREIVIDDAGLAVDGKIMGKFAREEFASLDGFGSWDELVSWFSITYQIPFRGVVIYW